MTEKVKKYIAAQDILSKNGRYLVALSGGADSVALLRVLLELGYDVEAAHCNFHLRGEESDRDELFCKDLCRSLSVSLHISHFDTETYATLHGVSIEMAARELRYNYFHQLLEDLSLTAVCVAHHRDDSVETVLLNMVRGTGLEGLKGIVPENGKVVRPLLDVSRTDIENYLLKLKQDYIVDSTNLEDDVQRNKVRLNVIPELKKINPSAVDNIQKLTHRVQDTMSILKKAISEAAQRICSENKMGELVISIPALLAEPGPETILWYLLKDKNFSSVQVEQIAKMLDGRSGREWESSTHILLLDRQTIIVQRKDTEEARNMKVPESGTYVYGKNKFSFKTVEIDESFKLSRESGCVCLDASKVKFPLYIRTVQTGDWFVPFGMKGKKLLSDFLTDRKLSVFDKRRQLVVVDANDTIIWVVGIRPDNRVAITDESKLSLVISFS